MKRVWATFKKNHAIFTVLFQENHTIYITSPATVKIGKELEKLIGEEVEIIWPNSNQALNSYEDLVAAIPEGVDIVWDHENPEFYHYSKKLSKLIDIPVLETEWKVYNLASDGDWDIRLEVAKVFINGKVVKLD